MTAGLSKLQEKRESKIIAYFTCDRPNLVHQIEEDIIEPFHEILENLGSQPVIELFIYSRGGATIVPLALVRLIRKYCKKFKVIVPFRAHSAATMICVGADEIYMSRKAELSPVDPQLTVMTPQGQRQYASTDLFGYLDFATKELGWQKSNSEVSVELLEFFHKYCGLPPDHVGKIYRMYTQSIKYVEELGESHAEGFRIERDNLTTLSETLLRGFGSHDYKIDAHEAKSKLGLNVADYDADVEACVETLYKAIASEMKFGVPFTPQTVGASGKELVGLILSENKKLSKSLSYKTVPGPNNKPAIDGAYEQWG